ncbi:DNA topoisomerase III [Pseudalkalibacillus hwajinpoensis]|uniref:DNA topoisomerase 3 n=1 Tax=Guptibacillus hwajinpoensis TaxID=208199 RepID=A0A4U1MI90_9BACL|nr:DNA topoisomerase III [Pseudalkalibacillus hwajinpoensis]TKD70451.1 DNA topoisomerase III [Pseudalkalibacillus hwajinpoensis]
MGKQLILAEKPSVGRDIARVLNCTKGGNGFLEGDKYIVTWALGHLVTLADPEVYDTAYKTWDLEALPMLPSPLKLVVIKRSGKQFSVVKTQMNRQDVSEIIIATDAGREGELVARWIIEKARANKPLKRLWISSVTDKAIREGFKQLKDAAQYKNLYYAAAARSEADWYVGLNATRALTTKYNAQLSSGRVQTPTLAMIAKKEEEIKSFKPERYYGLAAVVDGFTLTWRDGKTNESRLFNKEKIDSYLKSLSAKSARIEEVKKTKKKTFAPGLYDLTELQRDAHKRFGFSAKETLSATQRLYEQHKLVTYPRTDSRFLSSDMKDTLKERLEAIAPYEKMARKVLGKPIQTGKHIIDDGKVSDHHAIIPTEQTPVIRELSDKDRKVYDLIVKRFVAALYAPFEYEQVTVTATIGDERFDAKGKRVLAAGWKEVYQTDEADEILPELTKGQELRVISLTRTEGTTNPPSRFNEGTLLTAMEKPAQFLGNQDKRLAKTLGETGGLGTVATRADIIEKLFNSFLIEKNGKDLSITSKGKQLLELVPEELQSPALTAEWEQKLEAIGKGKLSKQAFIEEMKAYADETVKKIKSSTKKYKHDNLTGTKCPDCGNLMLEVKNKKGKMLVCQDRECGHRKGKSKVTNARCPKCKKKLELHGQGDAQTFICKCGHKEKLSSFNERRKKEKNNKASKRDVSSYMKKQGNDEPVNTALADALAKLKLDQDK